MTFEGSGVVILRIYATLSVRGWFLSSLLFHGLLVLLCSTAHCCTIYEISSCP